MKKLFTLVALVALCFGVQAKVVEYTIDYTTWTELKFFGWGASDSARERLSLDGSNGLHFHSEEATDPGWDCQFHPFAFDGEVEEGIVYTLSMEIKASDGFSMNGGFVGQNGWGYIQVPASSDWQTLSFDYDGVDGGGNALLLQCGDFVGDYWIKWIKVSYTEPDNVVEPRWVELLVNGDAEGAYGDVPCAYSKEFFRYTTPDGMPENEPYQSDIEVDPTDASNHVFVCHAKQVNKDDFAEGGQYYAQPGNNDANAYAWMNQFWIQSPHAWKAGEQVKISFRYRASKAAQADTQCHLEKPGQYKHWNAIGGINFTEEWQTYDAKFTVPGEGAGMWSIAFNLKEVDTDVDYFFDDLSWKEMELEDGFFVATANQKEGVGFNYSKAVKMEYDEDENYYFVTVGTDAEPVHELAISTKRGNDKMFQANTLKVTTPVIVYDDPDEWLDYVEKSKSEIKLCGTGVWKVRLDAEYQVMSFVMISGEADVREDIVANPTVVVVEGVERDWLGAKTNNGQPVLDEEGNPVPSDGEEGIGAGNTWDNQFFIQTKRPLKAGEETVIEFKYKGTVEAKTTTQCHKDYAGGYVHWDAIGDVTFKTEEQTFTKTFTIPDAADGMDYLAFNMAEIKGACTYTISDVIWKLSDESESLIDMKTGAPFWVKVGAGTTPWNWEVGPTAPGVEGDVDGDGIVDVADLNIIINVICGGAAEEGQNPDVDGDGIVDVADVNKVISIICG